MAVDLANNNNNNNRGVNLKNPLVQSVHYRAGGLQMHLRWRVRNRER